MLGGQATLTSIPGLPMEMEGQPVGGELPVIRGMQADKESPIASGVCLGRGVFEDTPKVGHSLMKGG